MKLAIYARHIERLPIAPIADLLRLLAEYPISVIIFRDMQQYLQDQGLPFQDAKVFSNYVDLDADTEIMLSLGGDGTFLDVAGLIADKQIPIMGINFGRLGFLADANIQQLRDIVDALYNKHYFVETRTRLQVTHDSETMPNLFGDCTSILNDCTVRSSGVSMLWVQVFLNGEFLCTYFADGIIIATPTGSTGYSLSCGGPILFPDTSCLLVTPIASHQLNVRPIVVPDDKIITMKISGRGDNDFVCALDTRNYQVPINTVLAVQKNPYNSYIVKLREKSFLDTLKEKLNWGTDLRDLRSQV